MAKRFNVWLLSMAGWFFTCSVAFAGGTKGLQEIYETPIPSEIRKNFNEVIYKHNTCPECFLGVVDGDEFFDVYPKRFLVLSVLPNSFGGVWAYIAVEGEQRDTYRLWLYRLPRGEYDFRSIEELPDSVDEEFFAELKGQDHDPYWR